MKTMLTAFAAVTLFTALGASADTAPVAGQPAPSLTLADANGKAVDLSHGRSKTVAVEGHNPFGGIGGFAFAPEAILQDSAEEMRGNLKEALKVSLLNTAICG